MLRSSLLRACAPRVGSGAGLRAYSARPQLADIDPAKLTITRTQTPKALLQPEDLVFGRTFSGVSPGCPLYTSC